jgi:hypothetical protein
MNRWRNIFAMLVLVVLAVPASAQTTAGASTGIVVPVTAQTASIGADFRVAKSYGNAAGYVQGGNSFGAPAILGTIDKQPVEFQVHGERVMRYEPTAGIPNAIGGSYTNIARAGVVGATIGGGGAHWLGEWAEGISPNVVAADFATVSGGQDNTAGGLYNQAVGGGPFSTVVGGIYNVASSDYSTVGGGAGNVASGSRSAVVGGVSNTASAIGSTVAGGKNNRAIGESSTVVGGRENTAEGPKATVLGGAFNHATGRDSAIGGGGGNTASGDFSFATGNFAQATHHRSFVLNAHEYAFDANLAKSRGDGEFVVYAKTMRMFVGIPGSGGCTLASGASGWSCTSDRRVKSDIDAVDGRAVLDRVVALPVARWKFTGLPDVAHMGPMAQDFHAAFNLGDDETRLSPMDVQGVALAAIQGLNAELEARLAEEWLAKQAQADEVAELKRLIEVLVARTASVGRIADAH